MPIFDPTIFDGSTGGFIFDDGGTAPTPATAAISTVQVQLEPLTLEVQVGNLTLPVDLEGS